MRRVKAHPRHVNLLVSERFRHKAPERIVANPADKGALAAQPGNTDRDPIALIARNNQDRLKRLIPLRYGRMLTSPFAFFRGSAILQAHDWPGNLRQLRNIIERLLILAQPDGPDKPVSADMLPADVLDTMPKVSSTGNQHIMTLPLREAREMFERDYLIAQINRFGGNISRTAEFVGMERSALHRKLKSLGV